MRQRIRKVLVHEGGFTLIELLIVIVILGILAAIVVFSVLGITNRGNQSACKADLKSVQVASEAYFSQYGSYVAASGTDGVGGLVGVFLQQAPSTTNGYTISYTGGGGLTPPTITGVMNAGGPYTHDNACN